MPGVESDRSDADVIERSQEVPEAFAGLYDRHAAAIFRFAARRLGRQAAEDVIAETFLAAFWRRGRYDLSRSDARPWLYGIAVNVIGKHRRGEVRSLRALARTGVDPLTDGEFERADDRVAAGAMRRELAAALAALPAEHREVLLLVAWADLSYEEVGFALGIPIGTVRSRLSRARRRVREELARADRDVVDKELSHERA
jgi:RNA polymerase sigma factor (sigma-70 family)